MSLTSRIRGFFKAITTKTVRRRTLNFARPFVEQLEDRRLLAWNPIGPAPLLNSWLDTTGAFTEAVSGRTTAVAIGQNNNGQPAMFIGAANESLIKAEHVGAYGTAKK